MELNVVSEGLVTLLLTVSAVLGGLMAGLFFAYSVSVVLALETLSASAYTTVMQSINETILNAVFGVAFVGAVVVPVITAVVLVLRGDLTAQYGLVFLVGVVMYLAGTFAVTMIVHIPMNESIATWSTASPPDDWMAVRTRWARWNHIRTTAAIISFVLYLAAIASIGNRPV